MSRHRRVIRLASATVPSAALVAATLAGNAHAAAGPPDRIYVPGAVSVAGNQFTYRANPTSVQDSGALADSYIDGVRITQTSDGGYAFTVDPEGISVPQGCGNPDQVYYCVTTPGVPDITFTGQKGSDYIYAAVQPGPPDPFFSVPATVRTGAGKDTILLGGLAAKINSGRGDDLISIESNPDKVGSVATPGGDVQGGKGIDTITYAYLATTVRLNIRVSLDGKANDGRPGEHDNIHSDIENVTGPDQNFTAIGSAAANVLTGSQKGNDRLIGRGGRDTLIGLGGNDRLDARDGHGGDIVDCGSGIDRVLLDKGDRMRPNNKCEQVTYTR